MMFSANPSEMRPLHPGEEIKIHGLTVFSKVSLHTRRLRWVANRENVAARAAARPISKRTRRKIPKSTAKRKLFRSGAGRLLSPSPLCPLPLFPRTRDHAATIGDARRCQKFYWQREPIDATAVLSREVMPDVLKPRLPNFAAIRVCRGVVGWRSGPTTQHRRKRRLQPLPARKPGSEPMTTACPPSWCGYRGEIPDGKPEERDWSCGD